MTVGERRARRLPGVRRRRATAVRVVAGVCMLGAVSTASAPKLYLGDAVTGCEIPI
jgi:hypothetical protein